MAEHADDVQAHPANAVFALMDERQFRFSVVRPALEEDKAGLCRLTTGKHQLRGFRNIVRAPVSLLLPVIADEANLSAELAQRILAKWFAVQNDLRDAVAARLRELGYEPREQPFNEEGDISWKSLSGEHAEQQFNGTFIADEETNGVMLMSLLLGWFGADEDAEDQEEDKEQEKERAPKASSSSAEEKAEESAEKSTAKKPAAKKAAAKKPAAKKPAAKKPAAKKPAAKKSGTKKKDAGDK